MDTRITITFDKLYKTRVMKFFYGHFGCKDGLLAMNIELAKKILSQKVKDVLDGYDKDNYNYSEIEDIVSILTDNEYLEIRDSNDRIYFRELIDNDILNKVIEICNYELAETNRKLKIENEYVDTLNKIIEEK